MNHHTDESQRKEGHKLHEAQPRQVQIVQIDRAVLSGTLLGMQGSKRGNNIV